MTDVAPESSQPGPAWARIIDDAAVFPPGDAPVAQALADHPGHVATGLVGSLVLRDTDLPAAQGLTHPVSVVVTGGAGQLVGPLALALRLGVQLAGVEVALRDPDDLPGNARRVAAALDAARAEGVLDDEVPVYLELPQGERTWGWQAAADVAAEHDLRLKLRTGGLDAHLFPSAAELAGWIDAAIERGTPFKCTAGLHRAVRHRDPATGFEHHGFLNVLVATVQADASLGVDEVAGLLETTDTDRLLALAGELDLAGRGRRWFTSFGSCSVTEPAADLRGLGLL